MILFQVQRGWSVDQQRDLLWGSQGKGVTESQHYMQIRSDPVYLH